MTSLRTQLRRFLEGILRSNSLADAVGRAGDSPKFCLATPAISRCDDGLTLDHRPEGSAPPAD